MRAAKSVVILLSAFTLFSFWLAGCGPTNGLPPLTGEYFYVSNGYDGTISQFSINTSTGALTLLGSWPASSGSSPPDRIESLAVHPTNEFLYVSDELNQDLLGLDIGDEGVFSGRIFTQNGAAPLSDPGEIAITPNGAFLYATSVVPVDESAPTGVLAEYSVNLTPGTPKLPNPQNGALTSIGTLSYADTVLNDVVVDSRGQYAYTTPYPTQSILQYLIQPNGTLADNGSLVLTTDKSSDPATIVTTNPAPSIECAYALDFGLNVLWEMQINPATGVLSLLGNVPLTGTPSAIGVHPSQKFIYVGTLATGQPTFGTPFPGWISVFTLSGGKLSNVPSCAVTQTSQISVSDYAISIAVEPMGKYTYATNFTIGSVAEYSVDLTTGALSPIGTVNTENPANPLSAPIDGVTTY